MQSVLARSDQQVSQSQSDKVIRLVQYYLRAGKVDKVSKLPRDLKMSLTMELKEFANEHKDVKEVLKEKNMLVRFRQKMYDRYYD